jgi:uncharacterized protein YxeA
MNKIVVVGIVSIIIVAIIAGILILNHPNSGNYNNTNTIVTFPPTTTTTTNTTTQSTTTISTTTSTTSVNTTSTNTSLNLQMNTFYFINVNSTGYYYIFVLNLTSYKEFLQLFSVPENSKIIGVGIQNKGITPTQIIEKGNYLFIVGYTIFNISFTIGNSYPTIFMINNGAIYDVQLIYEGNWTGSLP